MFICPSRINVADMTHSVWSDLHEHAETGLQQVCEASGRVLDVGTLTSVGVEHFLQELPQEGTVGGLWSTTQQV